MNYYYYDWFNQQGVMHNTLLIHEISEIILFGNDLKWSLKYNYRIYKISKFQWDTWPKHRMSHVNIHIKM